MAAPHQGELPVRADQAHTGMRMRCFAGFRQQVLGFSLPLLCFLLISTSTAIGLLASFSWGNANGNWVLLACLSGSVLLVLPVYTSSRRDLGPASSPISLFGGFAYATVGLALIVGVQAVASFVDPLFGGGSSVPSSSPSNWMFMVSLGVMGPVIEEMAFRGWAIPVLSRTVGPRWAVLLSAVAFAITHLSIDPVDVMFYLLTGLILGCLWLKVRVIWPGVLAHAANNLLVLHASADPGFGW